MVTISALHTALNQPASHFCNLQHLKVIEDDIVRSTYFAQTKVKVGSQAYLLLLPLNEQAMQRVERFSLLNRHVNTPIVPHLKILRNEMRYEDSNGHELFADILLEPLPDALPLKDAIATINDRQEAQSLISSLESLRQTLNKAQVAHNNISCENILIDSRGVLYPIRWYYATEGAGDDDKKIAALQVEIATYLTTAEKENVAKEDLPYISSDLMDRYTYCGNIHEGLIAVESNEGWGYIDCNGNEVIKPQYLWANDFCEGRAEVQTTEGMGLIDKQGNYILEPIYETVEFDATLGWVRVCKNNKWALYDYSGKQLCDWCKSQIGDLTQHHINEIL